MQTAVIGLGVLGASVARSLALAGASVIVFERSIPTAGTTSTTFAWTNSNRKRDTDYHQLNVAGMREHEKLARVSGGRTSYVRSGGLFIADPAHEESLAENVARLRSLDYPARWLSPAEATEIGGDLVVPDDAAIAYFESEGYVSPKRLTDFLRRDAVDHGASLIPAEVRRISEHGDRVEVHLADGERREFDRLVIAAGRWSRALAATTGIDIPMDTRTGRGAPAIGLLGYAELSAARVRCVVHTPELNLRPGDDRRIVMQALDLNGEVDPENPPTPAGEIGRKIRRRLSNLVAFRGDAPRIEFKVGFRSLPADGNTIAGFAPGSSRVYCLVSHGGITLAPLLGRLASGEIVDDRSEEPLSAFRLGRFGNRADAGREIHQPTLLGEQ